MMLDKEKEHINGKMEIPFQGYGEVINSMDKLASLQKIKALISG